MNLEEARDLVGKHWATHPARQVSRTPAEPEAASNVSSDQSFLPKTSNEQAQAGIGPALR